MVVEIMGSQLSTRRFHAIGTRINHDGQCSKMAVPSGAAGAAEAVIASNHVLHG